MGDADVVQAMLIKWRDEAIDECRAIWDERIENQYQQIVALRTERDRAAGELAEAKAAMVKERTDFNWLLAETRKQLAAVTAERDEYKARLDAVLTRLEQHCDSCFADGVETAEAKLATANAEIERLRTNEVAKDETFRETYSGYSKATDAKVTVLMLLREVRDQWRGAVECECSTCTALLARIDAALGGARDGEG